MSLTTVEPQKVHWWYESIVDWMLANPQKTKKECAEFFNVSNVWLYTLMQSETFKAVYAKRRAEHNGLVSSSIIEKLGALTDVAAEKLLTRVIEKGDDMTPGLLKDITEMGLEKLGYDGRYSKLAPPLPGQPANVQVNVAISTNASDLEEARSRMLARGEKLAEAPQPPAPLDGSPRVFLPLEEQKDEVKVKPLEAFLKDITPVENEE